MNKKNIWGSLPYDLEAGLKLALIAGTSYALYKLADHFSISNYDEKGNRVQTPNLVVISSPEVPESEEES